jgi:2-oxoglutarate ferredoxin oxidoreductase subunit gamma
MPYEEIICAGFGGQGVTLMGTLLVYAGMREGKNVVGIPSYGAEMRGGTANYSVILSDDEITSPLIFNPTTCIVMNQPSLCKFEKRLQSGGTLVVNSSMAKRDGGRVDISVFEVPASRLADELGNIRCANMVILGSYVRRNGIVDIHSLIASLRDVLPRRHHNLLKMNEKALRVGYEFRC